METSFEKSKVTANKGDKSACKRLTNAHTKEIVKQFHSCYKPGKSTLPEKNFEFS